MLRRFKALIYKISRILFKKCVKGSNIVEIWIFFGYFVDLLRRFSNLKVQLIFTKSLPFCFCLLLNIFILLKNEIYETSNETCIWINLEFRQLESFWDIVLFKKTRRFSFKRSALLKTVVTFLFMGTGLCTPLHSWELHRNGLWWRTATIPNRLLRMLGHLFSLQIRGAVHFLKTL